MISQSSISTYHSVWSLSHSTGHEAERNSMARLCRRGSDPALGAPIGRSLTIWWSRDSTHHLCKAWFPQKHLPGLRSPLKCGRPARQYEHWEWESKGVPFEDNVLCLFDKFWIRKPNAFGYPTFLEIWWAKIKK